MPSQSTILGTALLVTAAMAAPVPQITTTVSEPVIGWPGATVQSTSINPQIGDYYRGFGGFGGFGGLGGYNGNNGYNGYNGYNSYNNGFNGYNNGWRSSSWGRGYNDDDDSWNNYYNRKVQGTEQTASTETKIEKREAQWGPPPPPRVYGGYGGYGSYGGWGYQTYRPYGGYRNVGYPRWGSPWGYNNYYWRSTDETNKDAAAAPADLTAVPAADAAAPAAEATTTVQNTKRDLSKRQWPGQYVTYQQWVNYWNALRNGNVGTVGTASFGGIQPSFTLDSVSQPANANPFPGYPTAWPGYVPAYPGSFPGSFPSYYPGFAAGVPISTGPAAVPGLASTFTLDETKKQ